MICNKHDYHGTDSCPTCDGEQSAREAFGDFAGQLADHPGKAAPASSVAPQEAGEWSYNPVDRRLYSSDFTHDVTLEMTGDFADDEQRSTYAGKLLGLLNAIPSASRSTNDG